MKEAYAFVWRTAAVKAQGGETVYRDPGDMFAREPYSAAFADRDTGREFVMAVVHITFGDSRSDRTPEIQALDQYWGWLHANFREPIILGGDFNTPPGDPAWRALRSDAEPLITRGATTLGSRSGSYVSLYDNLWIKQGRLDITSSGIGDYPTWLGITHQQGLDHVSDHAPVYLTLGDIAVSNAAGSSPANTTTGTPTACVNLNQSSASKLDTLPHIGPTYANRIIAGRPWAAIADLDRISGISTGYADDIAASGKVCAL